MKTNNLEGTSIELKLCKKTYDNNYLALKPLDLIIKEGEILVLLGPSGCGKTTILRVIAGLEEVDEGGKITFNEEDVTSFPIEKRNVGMMFQSYALFPNMNVRDNIGYGLKVRKMKKEDLNKRVDEMLEMMKISNLAQRQINQLSGGQRQRVALARAIATQPKVLLLDEPLSALDASLRNNLRIEINQLLKKLGITTIYVTHDQSEAMAIGDRIVVMDNGVISQIGTPSELYNKPKNNFTAEFIGSINRFSATYNAGLVCVKDYVFNYSSSLREGNVDVLFRPEDAIITDSTDAPFCAKLLNIVFLGDRLKLILDIKDKRELIIETNKHYSYKIGQDIYFSIEDSSFIVMSKDDNLC